MDDMKKAWKKFKKELPTGFISLDSVYNKFTSGRESIEFSAYAGHIRGEAFSTPMEAVDYVISQRKKEVEDAT